MQINQLISSVNGDPFRSTTKEAKSEHLPSNSGICSTSPLPLSRFPHLQSLQMVVMILLPKKLVSTLIALLTSIITVRWLTAI